MTWPEFKIEMDAKIIVIENKVDEILQTQAKQLDAIVFLREQIKSLKEKVDRLHSHICGED